MLKRMQSKYNRFLRMHFLARSNVPPFSSKKESVIILKKREVYVPYNIFVFYICLHGMFFKNI